MTVRLLLVEPDDVRRATVRASVETRARVDESPDFALARARLLVTSYDWLVTNLRLHDFNGLHLVYLAVAACRSNRSLVYGGPSDVSLGQEARRAGAFFELCDYVPFALPVYVQTHGLPPVDRRDAAHRDRRAIGRGGRRCIDALLTLVR